MKNLKSLNTTALAYMGDGVYEVYIRKHVMETGVSDANRLHKMAVNYVKADAQALAIKAMVKDLTPFEQGLVRRARNRKAGTKAKNADLFTYKWATALEALIGYLFLAEDITRMEEIIYKAMEVIDEQSR